MAEAELDRAGVAKLARVGCLAVQCDGGAGKKSYQYAQTAQICRRLASDGSKESRIETTRTDPFQS